VLSLEAAPLVVPVEELTRSSSPASMLPAALSEALGISLSDVMVRYFDGSEELERVRRIEEALVMKVTYPPFYFLTFITSTGLHAYGHTHRPSPIQ
jgi:hypothetical protein